MSATQKRRGPNVELEALVFLFGLIALVAVHVMAWFAASWGGGPTEQPGGNPLCSGYAWPPVTIGGRVLRQPCT